MVWALWAKRQNRGQYVGTYIMREDKFPQIFIDEIQNDINACWNLNFI